jgi:hypothetical protein
MRKPIEKTSPSQEAERRARETEKLQNCLDNTEWSAVDEAAKCREVVPEAKLLEMRDTPTRFERQEAKDSAKTPTTQEVRVEAQGKTEWQRLAEGASEARQAYLRDHPAELASLAAGQEHLEAERVALETGQSMRKLRENQEALHRLERSRRGEGNASDSASET